LTVPFLGLHGAGLDGVAEIIDAAADQVLHHRPGAAIGHVRDIDAYRRVQQHARKMRARAHAGRAELHLALVRFHVGHELLQVVDRQVLAGKQDARRFRDQPDRREVVRRIVERLLVERLVVGVSCRYCRSGTCSRRGGALATRWPPAMPAAAADILDNDGLAEQLAHALRLDAGAEIDPRRLRRREPPASSAASASPARRRRWSGQSRAAAAASKALCMVFLLVAMTLAIIASGIKGAQCPGGSAEGKGRRLRKIFR